MRPVARSAARALGAGLALLAAAAAGALEWPLDSPLVAAGFGTPARGRIITGLDLATGPAPVRAADSGELLFAREAGAPGALPSTLGSFVAVAHGDGVMGLYAHLAPGSTAKWLTAVDRGEPLGSSGESGWIEGPGLYFGLFDLAARRWVNPLLLLPPIADSQAPLVRGASLASADGRVARLGEARSLPQGRYRVLVDCVDPGSSPWTPGPSAPHYLRLVIDGEKLAEFVYDVAWTQDGRAGLFTGVHRGLSRLSSGGAGIELAERDFRRGRSLVEILVRDRAGNERRASWTLLFE